LSLPVRSDDLFRPLSAAGVRALELDHGNGDLIRVLDALELAGRSRC
jgi:hypothetical protein